MNGQEKKAREVIEGMLPDTINSEKTLLKVYALRYAIESSPKYLEPNEIIKTAKIFERFLKD